MNRFILSALIFVLPFSAFAHLSELEDRARLELEYLDFPPRKDWIPVRKTSSGNHIYDVVIVGGGQSGTTIAFALMREKVTNLIIFDENDPHFEGPWLSYARMETLQTPKYTIGPDCDIPSLTVRAWYEAKYGKDKWEEIDYIPRLDWMEYLQWLRTFLNLPIENNTKVGAIAWSEEEKCFMVPCTDKTEVTRPVFARKIILATGLEGSGEWYVPDHIKENIPHGTYYQTSDRIDFTHFKGKKIGILGGGPSAFDNAYLASLYADEVHMFFRRQKLVTLNVSQWEEFVGFQHFIDLPDEGKWQFASKIKEIGQSPNRQSVEAAKSRKNIIMHFDSPWLDSKMVNEQAVITTPHANYAMDHLIIAIGWRTNLGSRKELKEFKDQIALWLDRYPSQSCSDLLESPYLINGFCFSEKTPGTAPYLNSIFNCTGGSWLSAGSCAGTGIGGMRYSIKLLVHELVGQLFVEDRDYHYLTLENYHQHGFE